MPSTPWYLDPSLQAGVYAPPGSDLWRLRTQANVSHGVPASVAYGGAVGAGAAPTSPNFAQAGAVNRFMAGEALGQFQANQPLFNPMREQQAKTTLEMLQGKVPTDVLNQITQQAAERGIFGGKPQDMSADLLRTTGATSLAMLQRGTETLSKSLAETPVAELYNPMSLFVPQTLAAMGYAAAREGARTPLLTDTATSYTPRSLNSLTYLPAQGGTWGAASPSTQWAYYNPGGAVYPRVGSPTGA